MKQEPLLYRRVNTRTRGVPHQSGGDYRHERNTKRERATDDRRGRMARGRRRGRDYTPLFRFLLSKVGSPWSEVYSEAKRRLDDEEPIFWLVALHREDALPYVRLGECSYYSGLYVDEAGNLCILDARVGPSSLAPSCACCTHTFNGVPFSRKYNPSASSNAAQQTGED